MLMRTVNTLGLILSGEGTTAAATVKRLDIEIARPPISQ